MRLRVKCGSLHHPSVVCSLRDQPSSSASPIWSAAFCMKSQRLRSESSSVICSSGTPGGEEMHEVGGDQQQCRRVLAQAALHVLQ